MSTHAMEVGISKRPENLRIRVRNGLAPKPSQSEQAFEKRILSRRRDPDVSRHRPGEVSQTRASVAAEGYSGVDGSRLKVLYSKMRRVYPRYQKPNRSAWHHK